MEHQIIISKQEYDRLMAKKDANLHLTVTFINRDRDGNYFKHGSFGATLSISTNIEDNTSIDIKTNEIGLAIDEIASLIRNEYCEKIIDLEKELENIKKKRTWNWIL